MPLGKGSVEKRQYQENFSQLALVCQAEEKMHVFWRKNAAGSNFPAALGWKAINR